ALPREVQREMALRRAAPAQCEREDEASRRTGQHRALQGLTGAMSPNPTVPVSVFAGWRVTRIAAVVPPTTTPPTIVHTHHCWNQGSGRAASSAHTGVVSAGSTYTS